jgi:hypothetical protein
MIDFRKPENRRELYIRWFVWQYRNHDLDTVIPLFKYIIDRQEYNYNQTQWLMFLYGNCYNGATSYAIWNELPDVENIDLEMLKNWNSTNIKRLSYQNDCKWSKGFLDKMSESYIKMLGGKSPYDFFNQLCNSSDPKLNYEKVRSTIINNVYKMGRYSTFFYAQALKECCGLNIEPTSMQYGYETQSPTDGLCYILNKEELSSRIYINNGTQKIKQKVNYTNDIIKMFDQETDSIIIEIKNRFPDIKVDYFTVETSLCSIKKLFRRREGRYPGYYLNRLMDDVRKIEKDFPGVDFDIVRDFYKECVPNGLKIVDQSVNKIRMNEFLDNGTFPEFNQYKDLANI